MALIIRAQLFEPGLEIIPTKEQYNQLFTMHGTIMLLMFATPLFAGFANVLMPLQIGAPDVAFPRLNAFAYWLFLFGSLIAVAGFLTPAGRRRRSAGSRISRSRPRRSRRASAATSGCSASASRGFGTILGAVNFITTIITMRAPGMTMFRMPIFTWNTLVTSILVLMAFPVLAAAILAAAADRIFGAHIYDPANGGVILWQHLFWFFGHPEVYIIALPFFGIISEIFPVFSRKPIFGYKTLDLRDDRDRGPLGHRVGAPHVRHRFRAAAVLRAHDDAHRGADGREDLQLDRHDVARLDHVRDAACCGRSASSITFVFGGLTGVILASPPLDFHVSDTYFVVAHFHYVVFGTVVFAMFAGFYFWWPKWTGKMLNERWASGTSGCCSSAST